MLFREPCIPYLCPKKLGRQAISEIIQEIFYYLKLILTFRVKFDEMVWINKTIPLQLDIQHSMKCKYRMRHQQALAECSIQIEFDSIVHNKINFFRVHFIERVERAVCPGQIIAFYDDDQCLGGGIICNI